MPTNGAARVKICCITDPDEARRAVAAGASALGLVSAMPSGPGVIDEPMIAEIAATVPPGIATFLLTAHTDDACIIEQQRACRTNTIQFVDRVNADALRRVRQELPGIGLVQVIHINGPEAIDQARMIEPQVDALLLDSGRPDASVRELGGTGLTHDWGISRAIRQAVSVPVYLAGGLNAGNVREAIQAVEPFGVDLCSGVRTRDHLDDQKLKAFIMAVGSTRPE